MKAGTGRTREAGEEEDVSRKAHRRQAGSKGERRELTSEFAGDVEKTGGHFGRKKGKKGQMEGKREKGREGWPGDSSSSAFPPSVDELTFNQINLPFSLLALLVASAHHLVYLLDLSSADKSRFFDLSLSTLGFLALRSPLSLKLGRTLPLLGWILPSFARSLPHACLAGNSSLRVKAGLRYLLASFPAASFLPPPTRLSLNHAPTSLFFPLSSASFSF